MEQEDDNDRWRRDDKLSSYNNTSTYGKMNHPDKYSDRDDTRQGCQKKYDNNKRSYDDYNQQHNNGYLKNRERDNSIDYYRRNNNYSNHYHNQCISKKNRPFYQSNGNYYKNNEQNSVNLENPARNHFNKTFIQRQRSYDNDNHQRHIHNNRSNYLPRDSHCSRQNYQSYWNNNAENNNVYHKNNYYQSNNRFQPKEKNNNNHYGYRNNSKSTPKVGRNKNYQKESTYNKKDTYYYENDKRFQHNNKSKGNRNNINNELSYQKSMKNRSQPSLDNKIHDNEVSLEMNSQGKKKGSKIYDTRENRGMEFSKNCNSKLNNNKHYHHQQSLLQKQEEMLHNSLLLHKKMLTKLTDDNEKTKKLKEILIIQKKINSIKREALELATNLDTNKPFYNSNNKKWFQLDKRTTVLMVKNIPNGSAIEDLQECFEMFGKLKSINWLNESDTTEESMGLLVDWGHRGIAERVKNDVVKYHDVELIATWYHSTREGNDNINVSFEKGNENNKEKFKSQKKKTSAESKYHIEDDEMMIDYDENDEEFTYDE